MTAFLSVWALLFGERPKAVAFLSVLVGLVVTASLPGQVQGVHGFAIWTLVACIVTRYPLAAIFFLLSALCYILEMFGVFVFGIQVASNLLGLAGLVGIGVAGNTGKTSDISPRHRRGASNPDGARLAREVSPDN